jgi:glycine cleavage system aminomethyltransferase T
MTMTSVFDAAVLPLCCSYTGEDGFELSIPNSSMNAIAEALVADPEVRQWHV